MSVMEYCRADVLDASGPWAWAGLGAAAWMPAKRGSSRPVVNPFMVLESGAGKAVEIDGCEMRATPRHAVCPATSLVFYEQTSVVAM